MRILIALLAAALLAAASLAPAAHAAGKSRYAGDYTLTVETGDPPQLTVEATVSAPDGLLGVGTGGGIDHLPNQWATFVQDLRAKDRAGRALTLTARGAEGWRIEGGYKGFVRLRYRVDLSYAMSAWPAGNEQAGIWMDGALYSVTKPLFVTGTTDGPEHVRFRLPDGWRASTPWQPAGEAADFIAVNREALTGNSIVLGRHAERRFGHGNFTFTLALLGEMAKDEALVSQAIAAVATRVDRVFPRTPPAHYLVTLFYAPQNDGEAFESSAAFTTVTRPTRANAMSWGNNLAHELHHIWIGGTIHGDEDEVFEWFDEGFTDYYADVSLVQTGLTDAAMFLRKAEKVMARYAYFTVASVYERLSPFEASRKKGRNRFGVYDGGWAIAFCLDGMIQQGSGGARALDDAMRALHETYALSGRPVSRQELFTAFSEAAGHDLADFFHRHVEGSEQLPLAECLGRAGLEGAFQDYAAEGWITPVDAPTAEQRRIFRRIVAGPEAT